MVTEKIKTDMPAEDCYDYSKEMIKKAESDTTKGGSTYSDALLKPAEF